MIFFFDIRDENHNLREPKKAKPENISSGSKIYHVDTDIDNSKL